MAWPRDAYVGQKVVCTRLPTEANWGSPEGLELGRVYTIREVVPDDFFRFGIGIDVGAINEEGGQTIEGAMNFRPVQPRSTETGIRILKEIAARKREPEGVEA